MPCRAPRRAARTATRRSTTCSGGATSCSPVPKATSSAASPPGTDLSFHGGSTSSGEPYDMYGMTAAHKTLPLPTYARVTNLQNGLSVVVRINDRGPFVANRLIDLSYTAAAKLDMMREGTTLVEVRSLTPGRARRADAQRRVAAAGAVRAGRRLRRRAVTRSGCWRGCAAPGSAVRSWSHRRAARTCTAFASGRWPASPSSTSSRRGSPRSASPMRAWRSTECTSHRGRRSRRAA